VLTQGGIAAVQPGETLEVRVGPGHTGPHITEVLSVDSGTAAPMASQQSSAQATTLNGPSVEETGTAGRDCVSAFRDHADHGIRFCGSERA
jgi:hypothetical protein